MRHWTVQRIAGAAGAELVRGLDRAADGTGARGHRLARGRARRPVRRAPAASAWTAGSSPPTRCAPGRGACSPRRRGRDAAAAAGGGAVLAAEHPVASLGALARAWRRDLAAHVIARDRLGRQDVDQGPDRRAGRPAPPGRGQPRELQHRDRAAARAARRAARHRGARAGAGDARLRPDRRADRDLRAGRRRDHEHRAGPPRADGVARGRGAGEGGAADGDARRRRRGRPVRRAAARAVPARRRSRWSRSARAGTCTSRAPRCGAVRSRTPCRSTTS